MYVNGPSIADPSNAYCPPEGVESESAESDLEFPLILSLGLGELYPHLVPMPTPIADSTKPLDAPTTAAEARVQDLFPQVVMASAPREFKRWTKLCDYELNDAEKAALKHYRRQLRGRVYAGRGRHARNQKRKTTARTIQRLRAENAALRHRIATLEQDVL